jgi:hypothetical protein
MLYVFQWRSTNFHSRVVPICEERDPSHYGYALTVAGVAPGKNVVGTVGMAMLVVKPSPLARSFGILAAEYPDLEKIIRRYCILRYLSWGK